MSARRRSAAVPAVLFWLAVGGCGGAQMRGAAREPSQTTAAAGAAEESPPDARAEIERLEREIAARSGAVPSGQEVPAGPVPGVTRTPQPPGVARNQGQGDGELVCEQACQATGSICQAARRICSLADQMDDDWARGRCQVASRTCTDTRRRASNACGAC